MGRKSKMELPECVEAVTKVRLQVERLERKVSSAKEYGFLVSWYSVRDLFE